MLASEYIELGLVIALLITKVRFDRFVTELEVFSVKTKEFGTLNKQVLTSKFGSDVDVYFK